MSAIGMLGAGAIASLLSNTTHSRFQNFQQNFQQLGQDLQSGNVSQAESDLTNLAANNSSSQPASSPGVVSQAFNQISQDLQSGNLTAAQSDYASLQQDLQQSAGHAYHHHAHHSASNDALMQMQQDFSQLGQALQSGNLNAAQQAYTALQTDTATFAPFGGSSNSMFASNSSAGTSVNFTA